MSGRGYKRPTMGRAKMERILHSQGYRLVRTTKHAIYENDKGDRVSVPKQLRMFLRKGG